MSFEKTDVDDIVDILSTSIESSKATIAKYGPFDSYRTNSYFAVDDDIVSGRQFKDKTYWLLLNIHFIHRKWW